MMIDTNTFWVRKEWNRNKKATGRITTLSCCCCCCCCYHLHKRRFYHAFLSSRLVSPLLLFPFTHFLVDPPINILIVNRQVMRTVRLSKIKSASGLVSVVGIVCVTQWQEFCADSIATTTTIVVLRSHVLPVTKSIRCVSQLRVLL